MAVALPTSDDVRKAREQAAKAAAAQAEAARTPILAVLGASDFAVSSVTRAVDEARARAAAQREAAQKLLAAVPSDPRGWFSPEQLRKVADVYRTQAEQAYAELIERGEKAWDRFRHQPQVEQAVSALETYTEKLDELVDASHDAAEKALAVVSTQTRTNGELVARAAQRFSGRAAGSVADVAGAAGETVAEVGAEAAAEIREVGADAATETRRATREAANGTAPKVAARTGVKTAARKPAARRTASAKVEQPQG